MIDKAIFFKPADQQRAINPEWKLLLYSGATLAKAFRGYKVQFEFSDSIMVYDCPATAQCSPKVKGNLIFKCPMPEYFEGVTTESSNEKEVLSYEEAYNNWYIQR